MEEAVGIVRCKFCFVGCYEFERIAEWKGDNYNLEYDVRVVCNGEKFMLAVSLISRVHILCFHFYISYKARSELDIAKNFMTVYSELFFSLLFNNVNTVYRVRDS